ncbi:MAG TPA: hypothetical protein VNL69_07465 [Bacteroidota bacterium]|nr:hypothetical protein [Bacteroidota bacterium]
MSPVVVIDVAHPPRAPEVVEDELLQAWTSVRNSPSLRVIKVIHGYGSTGKGGSTRENVRNWAFRNRRHFRAVLNGEDYTLFNNEVQQMRLQVGQYPDPDLQFGNPGITVLWVK